MKTLIISIFISFLILISCSKDEPLIDEGGGKWQALVSVGGTSPALMLIELPSGKILNNDIYFEKNDIKLSSPIEKMVEFFGKIYLFIPKEYKIEIIDNKSFNKIATLDFSSDLRIPSSICFANATTAYIPFENDNKVGLLDITNFTFVKTIDVGKNPMAIAVSGNQVYVTNKFDNTVSVIDSRTNKQEAVIGVSPRPVLIDVSYDGKKIVVISAGTGKLDSITEKSAALITLIEGATREIIKTRELGRTGINAIEQIPSGLSASIQNHGFVTTQTNLIRINTNSGDEITNIAKGDYLSVIYNIKRNELICLRILSGKLDGYTADPVTASPKEKLILPNEIKALLPL